MQLHHSILLYKSNVFIIHISLLLKVHKYRQVEEIIHNYNYYNYPNLIKFTEICVAYCIDKNN